MKRVGDAVHVGQAVRHPQRSCAIDSEEPTRLLRCAEARVSNDRVVNLARHGHAEAGGSEHSGRRKPIVELHRKPHPVVGIEARVEAPFVVRDHDRSNSLRCQMSPADLSLTFVQVAPDGDQRAADHGIGSRSRGCVMHRLPPRPRQSSDASSSNTSTPWSRSLRFVS